MVEAIPAGDATVSARRSGKLLPEAASSTAESSGVARPRDRVAESGRPDEDPRRQAADGVPGVGAWGRQVLAVGEVPRARKVGGELAGRHRHVGVDDAGEVALDRRVEVEPALVGEAAHGGRGQRHRDLVDPELRRPRDGPVAFDVGVAVGRRPDDVVPDRDRDGRARVELEHLVEHRPRLLDRARVRGSGGDPATARLAAAASGDARPRRDAGGAAASSCDGTRRRSRGRAAGRARRPLRRRPREPSSAARTRAECSGRPRSPGPASRGRRSRGRRRRGARAGPACCAARRPCGRRRSGRWAGRGRRPARASASRRPLSRYTRTATCPAPGRAAMPCLIAFSTSGCRIRFGTSASPTSCAMSSSTESRSWKRVRWISRYTWRSSISRRRGRRSFASFCSERRSRSDEPHDRARRGVAVAEDQRQDAVERVEQEVRVELHLERLEPGARRAASRAATPAAPARARGRRRSRSTSRRRSPRR